MRKHYLDNLRWITVTVVVLYHVIYIFNNLQPFGVISGFYENQWWDHFQTLWYPWFMVLLFSVAGMSARFSLERRTAGEFAKSRTDKLFVPVSLGLLLFHWLTGWVNMAISNAFDDIGSIPGIVRYIDMMTKRKEFRRSKQRTRRSSEGCYVIDIRILPIFMISMVF